MRMMMKVSMDVEATNDAIRDGALARLIDQFKEDHEPESMYFVPDGGKRTGYIVFDLKDTSDIPSVTEPWFLYLNAAIELRPCMDLVDLQIGVEKATARMMA